MSSTTKPARRLCRTVDEAFAAGWEDGADDPPLTETQVAKLAVLLRPYLRQPDDTAA